MIEVRVDDEGKGEGIILPMSQISFNDAGISKSRASAIYLPR